MAIETIIEHAQPYSERTAAQVAAAPDPAVRTLFPIT
jgi:hypothetical protein